MKLRSRRTVIALHCILAAVLAIAAGTHIVAIYKSLQPIHEQSTTIAIVTFNLALAGLILFRLGKRDVHDILLLTLAAYFLWSLFSFVTGRNCGCFALVTIHPLVVIAFDAVAALTLFTTRSASISSLGRGTSASATGADFA